MSAADIDPVIARIKSRIETVPDVGAVFDHDVFARDDLAELIVSDIAGTRRLRCWWISGPTMDAELAEQRPAGYQHRTWTYSITGVDGLPDGDDGISPLRRLGLAISDALDADRTLNRTCHRTWPTSWSEQPAYTTLAAIGVAVARMVMVKRVLTISTPT